MEVDDYEEKPVAGEQERDKTTSDFVSGLKERESLKKELSEKTTELNKVKGQNYDLLKKIEDLEKRIEESKVIGGKPSPKVKRPKSGAMSKKRVVKRKVPKKGKAKDSLSPDTANATADVFEDSDKLYKAIADRYPELSISTVLTAEKKFAEADEDGSGTIDAKELEHILDSSNLMFTKQQVEDILNSIDADHTLSIDFFECLEVLDRIRSNKKTGLPDSLKNTKTAICVVQ
eukprot:gene20142-22115_t